VPINSDHYAVVVGIDAYSTLEPLSRARSDALALTEWLRSPGGGGVPVANLHLILSAEFTLPDAVGARGFEVERAFRNIGIGSGARVGRRLYFYFAGHAVQGSPTDTRLLMADADSQTINGNISLESYRQYLLASASFDELIIIVDAHGLERVMLPPLTQPFSIPLDHPHQVNELTLLSVVGSADRPAGDGSRQRGWLTQAVLECLGGRAVDPQGRITSRTLENFVRRGAEPPAPVQVWQTMRGTDQIILVGPEEARAADRLVVEVPHWTTELRVYDSRFRLVPAIGEVAEIATGTYAWETLLSPGIYKVEAILDGITEQQLVLIRPGGGTRIKKESWKRLKISCAAPLVGTSTTRQAHADVARKWSRQSTWTWTGSKPADSRLFLLVRTLNPERNSLFAEGLTLFDNTGQLVLDFHGAVELNVSAGWMAFNAELPAGFYVLRRRRRGVRKRSQPLYLCPQWETQIFMAARGNPSLRTWTLNMARVGQGFSPDDETVLAAHAVLEGLQRPAPSTFLIDRRKMDALLRSKDNPWLCVVVAHSLLREMERARNPAHAALLEDVKGQLVANIGDHPDVRALILSDEKPAEKEFKHPPVLRASLRRVRRHASLFTGTIPLGSLTDCLMEDLVANSPWTAWRYLQRQPSEWQVDEKLPGDNAASITRTFSKESQPIAPTAFAQALPPSAPVFKVKLPPVDQAGMDADAPTPSRPPSETASFIEIGWRMQSRDFDTLPDRIPFKPELNLLDRMQAQTISAAAQPTSEAPAIASPSTVITIEECVAKLRQVARRLCSVKQEAGSLDTPDQAKELGNRLLSAAEALFARADLVLIADAGGRVLYGNGAFRSVIAAAGSSTDQAMAVRAWQSTLSAAPAGTSNVLGPLGSTLPPGRAAPGGAELRTNARVGGDPNWKLHRIALEDQESGTLRGYVNLLRRIGVRALAEGALERVDALLSEITLYVWLYSLGSDRNRDYLQELEARISQIEQSSRSETGK
jgi:Caspase domain